jgi:hypothetical protein
MRRKRDADWLRANVLDLYLEFLLIANLVLVAIQPKQSSVQSRRSACRWAAVRKVSGCGANPACAVLLRQRSAELGARLNPREVNETDLLRGAGDGANKRHRQHDHQPPEPIASLSSLHGPPACCAILAQVEEKQPCSGLLTLHGQLCLELSRRQIAERRVQALLVVDLFAKHADRGAGLDQVTIFGAVDIAGEYGVLGWKVNGAGGEGGSVTLLSGPDRTVRRSMLQTIESTNPNYRNIPIRLNPFGLSVWDSPLD